MAEYILEMKNIEKRFPGVIALKNVNLQLREGEILGIVGENGAGKSTLMKILSGVYSYGSYEGEILSDGVPIKITDVDVAKKIGIEMVTQEITMALPLSIAENLYLNNLPGKGKIVNFKKLYKDTQKILDYVHVNASPADKIIGLNSGQMQLISLMRAYIKKPRILVLDEPTSPLTENEVNLLIDILNELRQKGISCIYISHKLDEIFRICNRVMVLRDGESISCRNTADVNVNTLIEEMVGRKISNLYPKTHVVVGDEIMRVEHLTVPHPTIKERNIISDIGFTVKKGEILGIGGLVGAGRSEILSAIFGQLTKGVSKQIFIDDKKVTINEPLDAINAGIGFVTEDRKLNGFAWMLSVRDNMFLASLKNLPVKMGVFIDEKKENRAGQEMFERLNIKAPSLHTKVNTLSGGNQQKVCLAKWLIKTPKILFVDEPTRGVDVGAKAEIYKLMGGLVESGTTIIMVSSDLPELLNLSDRILVIRSGKITGEFEKEEIKEEKVMAAAIM